MRKQFESAADLDGYDDLKPEDQEKVNKAWEEGHVAEEDIPETAKKPEGDEEEEKPKKTKKKAKVSVTPLICSIGMVCWSTFQKDDEDGDEEEKPKKAPPKKKAKVLHH